jgi:hypothetical protein
VQSISNKLADVKSALENLINDEEEALENMPEGLKASEKGERIEEIIDQLKEAEAGLESAIENLDSSTA